MCPSHGEQVHQFLTAGKESRGCQTFDQVMVCIAVLLKVKDIEIHVFITIILILSQG